MVVEAKAQAKAAAAKATAEKRRAAAQTRSAAAAKKRQTQQISGGQRAAAKRKTPPASGEQPAAKARKTCHSQPAPPSALMLASLVGAAPSVPQGSGSAPISPAARGGKAPMTGCPGRTIRAPCSMGTVGAMGSSMPYSDGELEAEVDKALAVLFSGACDECTFEELFTRVGCDPRVVACGRDAVTRVLGSMEAANKVMHRDGRVHLL